MFVGCPEGCRYNTASAVYDLVLYKFKHMCYMYVRPVALRIQ